MAGGRGLRLRPLSDSIPKQLVRIAGKPLLQWIIEWLRDNNITNIIVGVAWLKDKIIDYFGNGSRFGVDITYSVHTVEGGTGEGFRLAISRYVDKEDFFAMNGDQITDLNLNDMASFHLSHGKIATVAVGNPRCPFGHLRIDAGYNIVNFIESRYAEIIEQRI